MVGQAVGVGVQTTPKKHSDGTVLIVVADGRVVEVVSDLQLDVQVSDASDVSEGDVYTAGPSRPLWEYVRKVTKALLAIDAE